MPDPLTLSVMSQIARKAGGKDPRPEYADPVQDSGQPHLTASQSVLLSELIHKKKTAASPAMPGAAGPRPQGTVSLDALVKSTKNR